MNSFTFIWSQFKSLEKNFLWGLALATTFQHHNRNWFHVKFAVRFTVNTIRMPDTFDPFCFESDK